MRRKTNIFGKDGSLGIDHIDIPIIVMLGAALGFLIPGVVLTILGSLLEAGEGQIWSLRAIVAGLSNVGLSIIIFFIGWLYWRCVFKKYRAVMPRLSGFGLLLALMSLFSTIILGSELYSWILYRA